MIREIKYFVFSIIIILFIFLIGKYYFSESNKKKSYRSLSNINNELELYSKKLPILENDTKNIIEYVKNTQIKKKKKFFFWELIDKNEE
tara:strand:+ start:272 stop:538 length:267 start_codon:yes stop_codon:yes gene_type:complete